MQPPGAPAWPGGWPAPAAAPPAAGWGPNWGAATPAPEVAPGMPEGLHVQGCRHEVVGGIVNGSFTRLPDLSHGKPVYKRDGQVKGLDVHVYFWDDRDGPRFNGWYFGMKVGGDEVWAFHPGKDSPLPPASGWQVPYDGPVDAGFLVTPSGAGAPPKRAAEEPLDAYGQPAPKQARQDWEASAAAQAPQPQMQHLQQPLGQQPPQPFHLQPQAQHQQMMQHWEIAQQWQQYQLMQQQQHMMQWQAAQQQQQQQQQQRQRQQQLLEQKKRAEEERRRKIDEAKRKRDEENRKRLDELIKRADEEKAVKLVMPIIQKLRVATPESFPVLKQELEDVLEKEKTRAGGQFQRLRMEADKALDAAAKCIEMIVARRRLVEEKLAAEEKRRRDLDEAAKALVEELRDLVEKAEAQSRRLTEAATPIGETDGPAEGSAAGAGAGDAAAAASAARATSDAPEVASGEEATSPPAPLSSEELLAACQRVEAEGAEAESMTRACTAFVLQKGPEMKRLVPMTLGGADPSDISHTLAKLLQHVRDLAAKSEKILARARATKERAGRRLAAEARARQLDAMFAKYDRDSDGLLSRKEAVSYAKAEFDFQIPVETLDRMWKTLVAEGSKGVPLSDFHRLKVAVGTAREVRRDRVRAVEREEREQVLEEVKDVLKEKIKDVAASVSDADKFVAKVEKQVQPLLATAKGMSVSDMLALSDETDSMIEEARAITAKVCQQMDAVSEGTSERFQQDVRAYAAQEAKPLDLRVRRMEARLDRATNLSRRFRELASKRREAEFQRLRIAALRVLRHNQRLRSVQDAEVFAESVSERDFVAFFEAANKDVDLKAEAAAQAPSEEGGEGAMAVEQALEQPAAPGQSMDVLTQEADKWLAGDLQAGAGGAPAEAGRAPAVAAEALAGPNADVPMEAPGGAGEPSAGAAAGEGAPTEAPGDASVEAEVPLEQSGTAVDAAPIEPPDSDKKTAVETVELSEEDTACLFNFLTEGADSISRQDLFTRLASSIIQPSLTGKERSTATVQHGISGRCVSPRRPSEASHRALRVR